MTRQRKQEPFRTLRCRVRFDSPAFLGDAEQKAAWRTPPFKALLRQWWRVDFAARNHFPGDHARMHREEAVLFGSAERDLTQRSRVRLALDTWQVGRLSQWTPLSRVGAGNNSVGADTYLGYGPIQVSKGRSAHLAHERAIDAGEEAVLRIAVPQSEFDTLRRVLALLDAYATIGGRSRNGWGSFSLNPEEGEPSLPDIKEYCVRDFSESLDLAWPHAIGRDQVGPLIWQTGAANDWRGAVVHLAHVRKGLRASFPLRPGASTQPSDRHWLAYPVTKSNVSPWRNLRLPNALRFKVRRDSKGMLRGIVFHMPCLPSREFQPDREAVASVWRRAHAYLDKQVDLERVAA